MSAPLPPHRPRTVTFTIGGVFLLGMWNAGRAIALAQQSQLLRTLDAQPDPRVRLVVAMVWAIVLWGLAVALRQKRPFTRRAIPIFLTIYAGYELLLWRIFAEITPGQQQQWLLMALCFLCAILVVWWALNRPAANGYFKKED